MTIPRGSFFRTLLCASLFSSVLAFAGCADETESPLFEGVPRDSAGVQIVQHPLFPEYNAPVFQAEYLMEVSDTLPFEAGEFGSVVDADVLPNGNLAVLDEFAAEVRVFSRDGNLVVRIGRKGEGPGELSGNWTLGILPISNARLALPDVVNQSIIIFGSDGLHERSISWDVMEETIPQWCPLSGDTVMVLITTQETNSWVKRTLDDRWRDTILVQEAPDEPRSPVDGRIPLFKPQAVWGVSAQPERLILSDMMEPNLHLYEEGALQRIIGWQPSLQEISDEDRDVLLRVVARSMGDPEGKPETALRYFNPPDRSPVVADVKVGAGLVMVQRVRPFSEMDQRILSTIGATGFGGALWDVFSWTGEYLGILDFGDNVEVFRLRGDTIVGTREDAFAVAHPFVARIPGGLTMLSRGR